MAQAYMAEQLVRALTSRSPQISPGRKEEEADWLVFEGLGWIELDMGLKGLVCTKD